LWLGVTAHPSAEWIARQLTEACGWSEPPQALYNPKVLLLALNYLGIVTASLRYADFRSANHQIAWL
jgi:hypothetical protein